MADVLDTPKGRKHMTFTIGRLLVTTTTQPGGAPILDGGSSTRTKDLGCGNCLVAHFGSLVIRCPGSCRALVLGWRDARTPWPQRYSPRALVRRARWVMAGRPVPVPMENCHESR